MRKILNMSAALLVAMIIIMGCGKDKGNGPNGPIATEQWEVIVDDGQGSGNWKFTMEADSTINVDGEWVYSYSGAEITCPFTNGEATVSDLSISFSATGTAKKPSAPSGYQSSPFNLVVEGTTNSGQGSGSYIITFSQTQWPDSLSGSWTGTRTNGSGITN